MSNHSAIWRLVHPCDCFKQFYLFMTALRHLRWKSIAPISQRWTLMKDIIGKYCNIYRREYREVSSALKVKTYQPCCRLMKSSRHRHCCNSRLGAGNRLQTVIMAWRLSNRCRLALQTMTTSACLRKQFRSGINDGEVLGRQLYVLMTSRSLLSGTMNAIESHWRVSSRECIASSASVCRRHAKK